MFDRRLLENFDWILLLLVLAICGLGLLAMYSATFGSGIKSGYLVRQSYWMLIGLGVALVTLFIHYRTWAQMGLVLHLAVVVLLVLVLLYGTGGPGSPVERWLRVGPVFVQPSEFSKFTLVLALSYQLRDNSQFQNRGRLYWLIPLMLIGIPFVLIIRQPDLGTALLLIIISFPILFLMGLRVKTLITLGVLAVAILPLAWLYVLKPYQKDRVLTFLNPERDPLGAGYHVIQSKIAVGSGQLWGKGLGAGTQGQLNFLPANHTDFIFSVFSEEWGFLGSLTVLFLFMLLTLWALSGVLKTRDRLGAIQTVGVVAIITSHVLINIGMTLGLMPVVGVPLPFFSYGGSSMLSMMFGVGLLLNIRMRRFEVVT
ncbi:MAG: rod shape-determining protein RodA [bacterium]